MAKGQVNLQDSFLNHIRRGGTPVVVYLVNGVQIRGTVKVFDSFTVLLESEGKQMLVYKHAISTIAPMVPLHDLFNDDSREEQ